MKYLVTGGAGFIGSHLIKELLINNYNVFCGDNLTSGHKSNISQLDEVEFVVQPM